MATNCTASDAGFHLTELARTNQPTQLAMVSELGAILSASPAVTHLLVHGSLASGTADRLSDVNFVVGVADAAMPVFGTALNDLMSVAAGALLPGWRYSLLVPFEGLGLVFLVPQDGLLRQIDLRLVPTSKVETVRDRLTTVVLLNRQSPQPDAPAVAQAATYVAEQGALPKLCIDLLIEHLVLTVRLHQRIRRGQQFLAYAEWHQLHTASKDLIKTALAPTSQLCGWYQLREEIALSPIGRACIADLEAAVTSPPIPTARDVNAALDRVLALTERICPNVLDGHSEAISACRTYLELGLS